MILRDPDRGGATDSGSGDSQAANLPTRSCWALSREAVFPSARQLPKHCRRRLNPTDRAQGWRAKETPKLAVRRSLDGDPPDVYFNR